MRGVLDKYQLKEFLEEKYRFYANPKFIVDDPIQIPHRFSKKEDIEIAGLLTATISWGNRRMIISSMDRLLQKIGDSPFDFVVNFSKKDHHHLEQFVHRTFNGNDCLQFLQALRYIYTKGDGLQVLFSNGYKTDNSIRSAIKGFRKVFVEVGSTAHTLKHIPNVDQGSACKRINMFLRWMVRPSTEGVDFGIWNDIPTSALMMPLDTHAGRVARALGLLTRKQDDWKAVDELTLLLRAFDGNDPVKYDYALFGLGVNESFGL